MEESIKSVSENLLDVYDALGQIGRTLPIKKNFANLADTIKASGANSSYGIIYYGSSSYELQGPSDLDALCAAASTTSDFALLGVTIKRDDVLAFDFGSQTPVIGKRFLQDCHNLTEISGIKYLSSIGDYFLIRCTSFNQNLTISSNITSIGKGLLYDCRSYKAMLTLETAAHPDDYQSLSTSIVSANMYVTGVTLNGSYASTWKNALPDRSTTSPYRKLILA